MTDASDRKNNSRGSRGGRGSEGRGRGGKKFQGHRERPKANPRVIAWEVLRDVDLNDAYANLLLPAKLERTRMSGPDAAMCTEMTYGTLRARRFYDAIIEKVSDRPVDQIEAAVLNAMRLGAHQILAMRVADHAAVSETVGVISKNADTKIANRAAGFVNAILRRITEKSRDEWLEVVTEGLSDDERLEISTSHPAWIIRSLRQALVANGRNAEELTQLLEAHNTPARVCLSVLDGTRDQVAQKHGEPTELSPIGVTLTHGDPAHVDAVASGHARVQDEGSQLVALALVEAEAQEDPADPWLDLCAGPGGKTSVLAAHAGNKKVDAVDASAHRTELVKDSTRAFDNVQAVNDDGREFAAAHPNTYARVLVDVPCSGLGALRRRPEARWRRKPSDIGALGGVQRDLLRTAIEATKSGGVIAYTTCSPHVAETLMVIEDIVKKQPVTVIDAPEVVAQLSGKPAETFESATVASGRVVQLWPHIHSTDGMFLALLKKD